MRLNHRRVAPILYLKMAMKEGKMNLKLRRTLITALASMLFVAGSLTLTPHRAFAGDDANDAYDPFIDYNEYEVEDEEEADINFFRNGRLLTAGVLFGDRTFTQGLGKIYDNNVAYGLYLSYFFDLRFALQFTFLTSSHRLHINTSAANVTGNASLNSIGVDIKYYFNTQNLTKGVATFNPYIIGGFSSIQRQTTVDSEPEFGKDSAMAFDIGAGVEFPILQKKMYVGAQALYQVVNFPDQNTEIVLQNEKVHTGIYPNGGIFTGLAIFGVNF